MASCSGTGSNNSNYELELIVTQGNQNIANNETTVNWQLILKSNGNYSFATWGSTCTVTINGSNVYNAYSQKNISAYSNITIANGVKTIPHNSDGTKSISFSASYSESSTAYYTPGDISCAGNMTLTTIPRASDVSCESGNIGETVVISVLKKNSSFTHTLTYNFGNLSGTISSKTSNTSISWEIPTTFYAQIPTSNSGIGTITCTTYNGNTLIGTSTCNFTAKVSNANPIFNNVSYKDTNLNVTSLTSNNQVLVKGLSNLELTISSVYKMVAQNGANPKNYVVNIDTITNTIAYSENTLIIDLGTVNSSGTQRLNVRAYDSRNNSTLVYKDIEIIDYENPVINAKVERLNNFEDTTTLTVSVEYSPVSVPKNNMGFLTREAVNSILSAQYRYRITNGTWTGYQNLTKISDVIGYEKYDNVLLNLDKANSYEIEIRIRDKFNTIETKTLNLDVGQSIFFISSNKKACYINGEKILTANEIYPVGSIYMSINSTNPTNLFGGTWEQIKDTFLLACGTTYSNGTTGGSATKTITQSNLPDRTMARLSVTNKYGCACNSSMSGWSNICLADAGVSNSQPMNIMPPYLAVFVWKRTA